MKEDRSTILERSKSWKRRRGRDREREQNVPEVLGLVPNTFACGAIREEGVALRILGHIPRVLICGWSLRLVCLGLFGAFSDTSGTATSRPRKNQNQ